MNPPKIMVFRPTMEEFKDFSRYVHYMESQGAHLAGLAKIIPPKEWMPTKSYDNIDNFIIPAPIEQVVSGQKGLFTQYNIQRKPVTVKEFRRLTNTTRYEPPFHENYEELERVYWKNITFNSPIYGADISGSLYDKGVDEWNISRLNTLLDVIESDYGVKIEGVNTAYLYFGMWKTTFAWHTEDMDLYSINYVHFGAPKSWYAVPPEHGKRLERLAAGFYPNDKSMCSSFLRHKMTLISPSILRQYGIPVNKITQEAGEFMITFPYGYHSGFNHGFNCAESTNFASERWINYGKAAEKCTCKNDTVTIDMDVFVRLFQPDQYDIWKMKKHETKLPYGEIPQAPDMTLHYPTWMEKVEEYRKKHELSNFLKKKLLTPVPYKSPKSKLLHSQAHCSKSPHKTKKVKKSLSLSDSNHRLVKVSAEQIDARQLQKVDTESRVSCINEELVDIPVEFPNQCLFDRIKNGSRRKSSAKAISCEDDVERILNKHSIADAAWQPNHPSKKSHRARSLDSGNNPKTSNCSVQCEPLCTLPLEVISEVPLIVKESKHTVKRRHPVSGKSSKQTCPNILVKCGHNDDNAAEESSMCEIKHFKTEKASFKDERDYNENVARLPPHCAICSLFKPHYSTPQSDVSTQGGLPSPIPVAKDKPEFVAGDRTTPLIPEVSFASSVNSPSPLAECQLLDTDGKSQLIQCCVCCVQTHSSCYGIEKPPADGAPWTCNRCMERDWSAQCSLCCIRGGALKRIIGGNNWAHVVCAIAIPEVYFEQTVHRNNINVSRIPQKRLKLKCAYRKSNGCGGICLQCCSGRCTVSFHTTCAHAAGITIEPGNWPFPVYVHCHKHTMLRINGPQETQQKPVEIDRFVVAKHKNGNYYSALVRKFKKEDFYKVNFKDNSWSDNLYAQDIVSHDWSTGESPVMGSAVQVKWTDGNVYEAEYRGHAEQETIQVEFDDALLMDFERHEIYTEEDPMPSKVRRKMRNQISFTRKAANY